MLPPSLSGTQRIVVNAVLAALVLRMLHLADLSLWLDEGATWWNATRASWTATALAEHNHPPVWWCLTRLSIGIFGSGEFGLRMPAVVCGVLSVMLAGLLARRLCDPARVPSRGGFVGLDRGAAVWVVVLSAGGAFWLALSQEARMYAGLLAEALGLSLLYLRWLDRGGRGVLVAYALLASLALHTHLFALWPILGHGAHALWLSRRTRLDGNPVRFGPFFLAGLAAGLSFVPFFLWFLKEPAGPASETLEPFGRFVHAIWRMAVGPALVPLDRLRVEAGPLAVLREQPVLIATTALLWFVPIGFGVRALARDRGLRAFLVCSVLLPSAAVIALGVRYPLVEEKYLVFTAPLILLVAVLGARTAGPLVRIGLLAGLAAVHALGLAAYHACDVPAVRDALAGGHQYGKEEWRRVVRDVERHTTKGDLVFLHAPFLRLVWDFYDPSGALGAQPLPALDRRSDASLSAAEIHAAHPELDGAKRVVLVLAHECTPDRDYYRNVLAEALVGAWEEGFRLETIDDPVQWGIRVVTFTRR
jgi:hypothetical protein